MKSHEYIGKHGQKAINGAVREFGLAHGNGGTAVRSCGERYPTRAATQSSNVRSSPTESGGTLIIQIHD
ncbi:hypothetical protein TNCV_3604531 [Trichonephila clavipes]|nr:hypothetical protein TNCV_3604531 [Trichonephila clavipes]